MNKYYRPMEIRSKFKIRLLMVLSVLFLFASSSWANMHEGHHNHNKGVSPFVQKQGVSLHCMLRGHSINDLCPHLLKASEDKTIPCVIGSSCGSHPFQKNAATSGSSLQLIVSSFFQITHFESIQALYLDKSLPSLSNNETVDPPPKLS